MADEYLVLTGAMSWGKGKTQAEAVANAHANAYMGRKEYELAIYRFPQQLIASFYCDEIGNPCWEWRDEVCDATHREHIPRDVRKRLGQTFRLGRFKRSRSGRLKLIEEEGKA